MKKLSRKQKLIGAIAIILVTVILAIVITTNIVNKGKITSEDYSATTANTNSNLVANYIKKGITIGGITGTWIPSGVEFEEITFSFEGLKIKQNKTKYNRI